MTEKFALPAWVWPIKLDDYDRNPRTKRRGSGNAALQSAELGKRRSSFDSDREMRPSAAHEATRGCLHSH